MGFLQWLENTGFAQFIASSTWANLVLLCLHALGMGVLVGILWILDLRVLGFPRSLPFAAFRPLVRLAWLGFVVNAVSGILLFTGAATRFIINTDFQLKMLLMALAGLSVLVLQRSLAHAAPNPQGSDVLVVSPLAKIVAALSFLFWFGVILFGRQIAYTLARPAA
jgi:hypothetical protein